MEGADGLCLREVDRDAVISVKVVPGSSRSRVLGALGDCLKVAVAAAPEKGKANKAVASVLAEFLGVDKGGVILVAGRSGPRKQFRVLGKSAAEVLEIMRSK